jgi:hypothetical protein
MSGAISLLLFSRKGVHLTNPPLRRGGQAIQALGLALVFSFQPSESQLISTKNVKDTVSDYKQSLTT